jgi:hypothetical protein
MVSNLNLAVLIDDRTPPPRPPDRPVWEPNWPMWGWIAAAVLTFYGATATSGVVTVLLVFASVACAAQAATRGMPYDGDGMRGHRQ